MEVPGIIAIRCYLAMAWFVEPQLKASSNKNSKDPQTPTTRALTVAAESADAEGPRPKNAGHAGDTYMHEQRLHLLDVLRSPVETSKTKSLTLDVSLKVRLGPKRIC